MSINRHDCGERSRLRTDEATRLNKSGVTPIFSGFFKRIRAIIAIALLLLATIALDSPKGKVLRGAEGIEQQAFAVSTELSGQTSQLRGSGGGSAVSSEGVLEEESDERLAKSRRIARELMDRVLRELTLGRAFEAKLRMRSWAAGQVITEVGRYQQAGKGAGRWYMDLHVPIADGNARWQQICDGRLAWTREELGEEVQVRRVDLGLFDELWSSENRGRENDFGAVPPRLRIGGLAEIVDRIQADYELSYFYGSIEDEPMLVVKGAMRDNLVAAMKQLGGGALSPLVPRYVRVAIPADSKDNPLPARIEFLNEPTGRPISLLEIYNVTAIEEPPAEWFRFESGGEDFVNETEFYLRRFGAR